MPFRNCGIELRFNWIKKFIAKIALLFRNKKIKMPIWRCAFTGWNDCCTLLRCAFAIMLFVPTSVIATLLLLRHNFSATSNLILGLFRDWFWFQITFRVWAIVFGLGVVLTRLQLWRLPKTILWPSYSAS